MSKYTEAMDHIEKNNSDNKNEKSLLSYPETGLKLRDPEEPFFKRKIVWLIGGLIVLFVGVLILGIKKEQPVHNIPLPETIEEQGVQLSVNPANAIPGETSSEVKPQAVTFDVSGAAANLAGQIPGKTTVQGVGVLAPLATEITSNTFSETGTGAETSSLSGEAPVVAPEPAELKENFYTIQVITYQTEARANAEAKKLEEKNLKAFALKAGKYYGICVGRYADKKDAVQKLSEVKASLGGKFYADAYIRFIKQE